MATILVADDSAADRHLIESLLREGPGWSAVHAAGGREALAAIGRQMPDLVLTDLHMPGMDGLELVREVRDRHPHCQEQPNGGTERKNRSSVTESRADGEESKRERHGTHRCRGVKVGVYEPAPSPRPAARQQGGMAAPLAGAGSVRGTP